MALAVGDRRSSGHREDPAAPRAADPDGQGAALCPDQEVAVPDPGPGELAGVQAKQAVGSGMWVVGGGPIRHVGGAPGLETGRNEAKALDADVSAGGQTGAGD